MEPVYVTETPDEDFSLLWQIGFLGKTIASTHDRQQLDQLLESVNRPVRWLVPA